jgi:hypothetical protein
MKAFLKHNGLTIVLLSLFLVSIVGQALAGFRHHLEEEAEHGGGPVTFGAYLRSGDFLESVFENWESEFLQMAAFLVLSGLLVQRGAAESKKPEEEKSAEERAREKSEDEPAGAGLSPKAPWPVRRGGVALSLYSHSMSIALGALFLFSFALHGVTGLQKFNDEAIAHGQPTISLAAYFFSSTFWFESLQNWQSEFMSIAMLILLSIVLREKGSPESKPVHAPHAQTGAS